MEIRWLRGMLDKDTRVKKGLKEVYRENGVEWVDGLVAGNEATAVSSTSRLALSPVAVPLPLGADVKVEGMSVAETLKRQLVAAQPRSAKKARLG